MSINDNILDIADDPINNIEIPVLPIRSSKSWDISYNTTGVTGVCGGAGGINSSPVNTHPINSCDGDYSGLTELRLELDQQYILGDKQWEITQTYQRVPELTNTEFELDQQYSIRTLYLEIDQKYSLDSSVQNLREAELTQEYLLTSLTFAEELLGYVNDHRDLFGLVPIEDVWHGDSSVDIATIHCKNMAEVEILAHEHPSFPVGWQTIQERSDILSLVDGHTFMLENLGRTYASPAQLAMGFVNESTVPVEPYDLFYGWKTSPPHNAAMLWDWKETDHPVMALGLHSINAVIYETDPYLFIAEYSAQLFFGYGVPEDKVMISFEITQDWSVEDAPILILDQEYVLDAYFKARAQHETSYSLHISAQHETSYVHRIAVQHEAPIHYTLSVQHETLYSYSEKVAVQHEASYDLKELVVQLQHETSYGIKIQKQHEALHSIMHKVTVQHESPYTDLFYVKVQHESDWDINTADIVQAAHSTYWTMESSAALVPIITDTKLSIGGVGIPVLESLISSTEDRVLWTCRVILKDLTYYSMFVEGVQFSIDLQGDIYVFQYTTKAITRSGVGDVLIVVEGSSPAVTLQSPRADNITVDYDISMLAQDIIEDILGQAVTWDFPSWYIPAHTIVADDAEPLALAKRIVETAGGLLESNIDGTLLVRRKYLVNTTGYGAVTPSQVYSDVEDNLSASINYEIRLGYNKYRVTDSDPSYGDLLEFIQDEEDATKGKVRAYPIPWRVSIEVVTSDAGSVYLGNPVWVTRDEEAIVEFVEGEASLPYIAESITSIDWHSNSLGGIIHTQYDSKLQTPVTVNQGYGLATINYKVKCLEYDTVGTLGTPVQYIIADS